MIIETFNAVDDNGNLYRVSIDQEYTIIRDRSGKTEVPGMKHAFDSQGRDVNPVEPPDLWEIAATQEHPSDFGQCVLSMDTVQRDMLSG